MTRNEDFETMKHSMSTSQHNKSFRLPLHFDDIIKTDYSCPCDLCKRFELSKLKRLFLLRNLQTNENITVLLPDLFTQLVSQGDPRKKAKVLRLLFLAHGKQTMAKKIRAALIANHGRIVKLFLSVILHVAVSFGLEY